jgi:hypothetical protein
MFQQGQVFELTSRGARRRAGVGIPLRRRRGVAGGEFSGAGSPPSRTHARRLSASLSASGASAGSRAPWRWRNWSGPISASAMCSRCRSRRCVGCSARRSRCSASVGCRTEREGCEGGPEIVDPPGRVDSRGDLPRPPVERADIRNCTRASLNRSVARHRPGRRELLVVPDQAETSEGPPDEDDAREDRSARDGAEVAAVLGVAAVVAEDEVLVVAEPD